MKAWSIFTHSFEMVLRNYREALKIGLVPLTIGSLGIVVFFTVFELDFETFFDDEQLDLFMQDHPGRGFGALGLSTLSILATNMWVVVNWHRYVLLEEQPQGWLPRFRADRMLAYFGRIILLSILVSTSYVVAFIAFAMTRDLIVAAILFLITTVCWMFAFYRLLPILPAAAIGKRLKLGAAWRATKGTTFTVFALGIILVIFNIGSMSMAMGLGIVPILGLVLTLLAVFAIWLVNISVLTTFYGHYVEGRQI